MTEFTLPAIEMAGYGPDVRAHMSDALYPGPADPEWNPIALHQKIEVRHGAAEFGHSFSILLCSRTGTPIPQALTDVSREMKDRFGGASYTVMAGRPAKNDIMAQISRRNWFQAWDVHYLARGIVLTAENLEKAITQLTYGYGKERVDEKILSGVICPMIGTGASNHEKLSFSQEARRLISTLLCKLDAPSYHHLDISVSVSNETKPRKVA